MHNRKYYVIFGVVFFFLLFYLLVQRPESEVFPPAVSASAVYFHDAVDEAVRDTLMSITRLSLSYRVRDENNNISIKKFFGNGNIHIESEVEFGIPSGFANIYYENGVKKLETEFFDGQLSGKTRYYNEDGILLRDYIFSYGRLNGICYEYYPNGIIQKEKTFVDGQLTGDLNYYHYDDGRLLMSSQYRGNIKHGDVVGYDEHNVMIFKENFASGVRTVRVLFDHKGNVIR